MKRTLNIGLIALGALGGLAASAMAADDLVIGVASGQTGLLSPWDSSAGAAARRSPSRTSTPRAACSDAS